MLFLPHYCFKKLKINKSKITLKYFQPSLSKLIDWLRVVRGKFQRFTNNKKTYQHEQYWKMYWIPDICH